MFKLDIEHSNKYLANNQDVSDLNHGMSPIVNQLIGDMLIKEPLIMPSSILTRLQHEVPQEVLPTIDQIQQFKYRYNKKLNENNDEMDQVDNLIEKHKYHSAINPNEGFIFASRNGTGSDEDPIYICITALSWLTWLQRHVILFIVYLPS